MEILLFSCDPLNITQTVLREGNHTVWTRQSRKRRNLFDLAIIKSGELREYDKFKARCIVSLIRPPINRLPEYYFYKYEMWPSQFGVPISEPYTFYLGTHRSIDPLPEDFLDNYKSESNDMGLTTKQDEFFYLLYQKPGERRVFSSRYPLPQPRAKMYLENMKNYEKHDADPIDFQGLYFLPVKTYFDIFGVELTEIPKREAYNALSKSVPSALIKTLVKGIQTHLETQGPIKSVNNLTTFHSLYHKLCKFEKTTIEYENAHYTFTGNSVYDQKVASVLGVSIRQGWTVFVDSKSGKVYWEDPKGRQHKT